MAHALLGVHIRQAPFPALAPPGCAPASRLPLLPSFSLVQPALWPSVMQRRIFRPGAGDLALLILALFSRNGE